MRKNRKKEIFQTAIRLFKEKSYDEVTVEEICAACSMTKKSFYYHFRSKQDVILLYYRMIEGEFDWDATLKQAREPGADCFELYWQYERFIIESTIQLGADLLQVMMRQDLKDGLNLFSPYTQGEYRGGTNLEHAVELILMGQKAGQIRQGFTPQQLLFTLFSAAVGIGFHWSTVQGQYSQLEELRKAYEVIFRPQK